MTTTTPERAARPSTGPSPLSQTAAMTTVAIRDRLTLVGVIVAAMVAMGALTGALWPSLRGAFADLPTDVNDAIGTVLAGSDLTTAAGWMNTELVSLLVPGGLIAVAVISAAKGIAGEEADKTLGVLLSVPVSRATFLAAKTAAMIVTVLLATLGVAAGILIGNLVGDLAITTAGVLGTCAHGALLAILFGAVTVLVAALTGDKRLATVIPAGLAVLAFALNAFLPLADAVAGYAKISPWYYFADSNPLVNGPGYSHLLVLAVVAVALLVPAFLAYRRRDLHG